MNPITIRKVVVFLLHAFVVGMFLVILSANVFQHSPDSDGPNWVSFFDPLITIGSFFVLTYVAYWVFLPKFLITGQTRKLLSGIALLWGGFLGGYFWIKWLLVDVFDLEMTLLQNGPIGIVLLVSLFAIVVGSLFRILTQWFKDAYEKAELERQGLRSELALLKHQLNPHFLFNSLNNIDALIHAGSPNASAALNRLSEMMRYVVYDSEREVVSLEDEMAYIENYIDLQKLRLRHPEVVEYEVVGEVGEQQIAPMLFISFIENAFKHSALQAGGPGCVQVRFEIQPGSVRFRCMNKVGAVNKDSNSGIGLENIHKRLDLIYKDRYELAIDRSESEFSVYLDLNI